MGRFGYRCTHRLIVLPSGNDFLQSKCSDDKLVLRLQCAGARSVRACGGAVSRCRYRPTAHDTVVSFSFSLFIPWLIKIFNPFKIG